MNLKVTVAQLQLTADPAACGSKLEQAAARAQALGSQLLLAPQLALCGGVASDLLWLPSYQAACEQAWQQLLQASRQWSQLGLVLGRPLADGGTLYNAVSVIRGGALVAEHRAQLPAQGPGSDLRRWFSSDDAAARLEVAGMELALLAGCEWPQTAVAAAAGADALLVAGGQRFCWPDLPGQDAPHDLALPVVYANLVGGRDELIFEGHSFVHDAGGNPAGRGSGFAPDLLPVQLQRQAHQVGVQSVRRPVPASEEAALWAALILALQDYVHQGGFREVALGLSGGLDSALVLALAVDALGPDAVRVLLMPSPYTASISVEDARDMVARLGVRSDEIDIAPAFDVLKQSLSPLFAGQAEDLTEENLQARIRGMLLMAVSNKFGPLILVTSNKSEAAVGYSTLYGDMCGGFAPICDVPKTVAYRLARWRNANAPGAGVTRPIPERIITRPPSAELRPDQTDQDSLPSYDTLDHIVQARMVRHSTASELAGEGLPAAEVRRVLGLLAGSQYKRQQAAPGPQIGRRPFGQWRHPLTGRFTE